MTPFLGASAPWRQHVATGKQASKTCQGGHRGEGEKKKEILFTRRKAIHLVQFFPSVSISGVLYLKSRDTQRPKAAASPAALLALGKWQHGVRAKHVHTHTNPHPIFTAHPAAPQVLQHLAASA